MAQVMGLFTEVFDPIVLQEQIRNVLSELLLHSMLNVNLMYNSVETNIVEMITWFPYEGVNCATRIINLRIIDQCEYKMNSSNGSDANIVFLPKNKAKKIPLTLHGCPLKVSSSVWVCVIHTYIYMYTSHTCIYIYKFYINKFAFVFTGALYIL